MDHSHMDHGDMGHGDMGHGGHGGMDMGGGPKCNMNVRLSPKSSHPHLIPRPYLRLPLLLSLQITPG